MNLVRFIGSQFSNPRGFWGRISSFFMNRLNKKQYKSVVKTFYELNPDTVLDIGFGNGYLLEKLSKKNSTYFHGIEMSESMIESATKRNIKMIKNQKMLLSLGDVVDMEFQDSMFDFIYTVNTVYFWSNLKKGYEEIHRTLKPGGTFANVFYTKQWLNKLSYTNYDFTKYSQYELLNEVLSMNFSDVDLIEIKKDCAYCLVVRK